MADREPGSATSMCCLSYRRPPRLALGPGCVKTQPESGPFPPPGSALASHTPSARPRRSAPPDRSEPPASPPHLRFGDQPSLPLPQRNDPVTQPARPSLRSLGLPLRPQVDSPVLTNDAPRPSAGAGDASDGGISPCARKCSSSLPSGKAISWNYNSRAE